MNATSPLQSLLVTLERLAGTLIRVFWFFVILTIAWTFWYMYEPA